MFKAKLIVFTIKCIYLLVLTISINKVTATKSSQLEISIIFVTLCSPEHIPNTYDTFNLLLDLVNTYKTLLYSLLHARLLTVLLYNEYLRYFESSQEEIVLPYTKQQTTEN